MFEVSACSKTYDVSANVARVDASISSSPRSGSTVGRSTQSTCTDTTPNFNQPRFLTLHIFHRKLQCVATNDFGDGM
jgi:hypothetical protein